MANLCNSLYEHLCVQLKATHAAKGARNWLKFTASRYEHIQLIQKSW